MISLVLFLQAAMLFGQEDKEDVWEVVIYYEFWDGNDDYYNDDDAVVVAVVVVDIVVAKFVVVFVFNEKNLGCEKFLDRLYLSSC